MPKTKTYLTPAEYAVLGLVRRQPTYGYELQRQLSGRHGLGLVCPVEPAMVYAILKSLSGLELIDGEWDNRVYPHKAIYSTTLTGAAEFERWMRRPVDRMRQVRLDLLVKLFFLLEEDPASARELIEAQLQVCRAYAEELQDEAAEAELGSFDSIALGAKLSAAHLTSIWLQDCLASIKAPSD